MFYDCIYDQNGRKADNGLIEGCCCCHTEVGVLKQRSEYVCIDNIGFVEELSVVSYDLIEHLEITTEDSANLQKKHGDNGRKNTRKSDKTDSLKNICSVDGSCFVNLSVNAGNCCDVDNRVVSTPFPGVEQADDPWPYTGFGCIVHIDSLTTKEGYDAVQETGFVVEDIVNKDSNNNPGNEVR